jgi:hypothetical protein
LACRQVVEAQYHSGLLEFLVADRTVFISTNAQEWTEYLIIIRQRLQDLAGWRPIYSSMEGYQTAPEEERKTVESCDLFVGIVGHCYGHELELDRKSLAETEYDWARTARREQVIFIAADDFRLPANLLLAEKDKARRKQWKFRKRVKDDHPGYCRTFSNSDDLASRIASVVVSWESQYWTSFRREFEQELHNVLSRVSLEESNPDIYRNFSPVLQIINANHPISGTRIIGDLNSLPPVPIRILFLGANPTGLAQRQSGEEAREIQQTLLQSNLHDKYAMLECHSARPKDIQSYLLRHRPDIVHLCGYGDSTSEIILVDDSGIGQPVSASAFSRLFSVLKDNIRCVFFSACFPEPQALEISKVIDCVIWMSEPISNKVAFTFAAAFYEGLGYGRDIKTAFDLGCVALKTSRVSDPDIPDIPRLLSPRVNPELISFPTTI